MIQTMQARGRVSIVGSLVVAALIAGLSGCGLVRTINNVKHAVDNSSSVINAFTQGLKSGGGSQVSVTYAVQPPKDVTFKQAAVGSGTANLDLVSNSSGEYSCTSVTGATGWVCQKLGKAQAVAQNQIVNFYTPSHWVAFLQGIVLAAGFVGGKVTNSTMTVNGISMRCVNFSAKGVQGTSTICSTSQGILGYVKVAGSPTSFELKSYTSSPPASLFQLPAGAKITTGN